MATLNEDTKYIFSEFDDAERQRLINEFLVQNPDLANISRFRLFMLWFSDLETLRAILTKPENRLFIRVILEAPANLDVAGILAGRKTYPRTPRSQPSRIPGPRDYRSRSGSPLKQRARSESPQKQSAQTRVTYERRAYDIKELAKVRDGDKCVLTKQGLHQLKVAYIMPFEMHNTKRQAEWDILEVFWGRERVLEWQRELLTENSQAVNTEQVKNLILLSVQAHAYWDACACAFRPIKVSEDKTSMEIAFHWLPLRDDKVKAQDLVPINENPYGPNERGYGLTPGNNNYVFDMNTQCVIPSGSIFTATTDDPVQRPLPSFALLQLQWNLHRVAAMQGATEDDDSDIDSDGDSITVPSGSQSPIKEQLVTIP